MKCLKSTVFVPTSLVLAMAVVLPSMAFASNVTESTTYRNPSEPNSTIRTTIGYNGTVYQDTVKNKNNNEIIDGWKATVSPWDIRLEDRTAQGDNATYGIATHSRFDASSMTFYALYNTEDREDLTDEELDLKKQPSALLIQNQARFGREGVALFDHNSQNGVFMDNEQLQYVIADKDNKGKLTGSRSGMFLSAGGIGFGKIDNKGAVTPTGVTITQDGIKSFREAKADDDVVTLGKVKSEIKDSEARITRSLNASIAGMIGVPPSSPPPSAAIKQLNDNLAATDKRLDESNQRLNSAIDINDGVLTIKNDMNANNKKITKVANATDDGDAVNLGQLKAYVAGNSQAGAGMNQLKGDIVRLDKNLKQGMAAQSALNGLFQPYGVGKFSATAAIGGYGTETAVAVGTGYRFNENLAGKGGIAFPVGNASQATYNLGVNYEW